MSRPWQTWLLFALCLAIVFGAMGWVSGTAARLERSEGEARRWAAQQENVRLALWRMDSAMAPLIVQESARPYFTYRAFYQVAPEIPFVTYISGSVSEDGLGPSPLMTVQPPQVLLYFQFGPDGDLTSPQVPTGRFRDLAVPRFTTVERIEAASARLAQFGKTFRRDALLAELPPQQTTPPLAPDLRFLYGGNFARAQPAANPPNAPNTAPALPQVQLQAQDQPPPNAANAPPPQPAQPAQNAVAPPSEAIRPNVASNAQQPAQMNQNGDAQQFAQQAPFAQTQQKVHKQITRNNEEFQARVTQNYFNINQGLANQKEDNGLNAPNNAALKPQAPPEQPASNQPPQPLAKPPAVAQPPQEDLAQSPLNAIEYQARHMQDFANMVVNGPPSPAAWNARELQEGVLKPLWAGSDLLLARRVRVDGRDYIQGCLLDWPGIRASLLAVANPLLPQADLAPAAPESDGEIGYRMASLPVRLIPGPVPQEAADGVSPVWLSLGIAWACVLAAAAFGAVVLARAISLSERRGAFVSAVTHELRTPLTTFKMYAEMLAEDMVPDEAKKRQYLQTLRTESVRLGHLVENVLSYARLERGRGAAAAETTTLEALIARQRDRLAARAEQAGMVLVVEPGEPCSKAPGGCMLQGEHWQAVARVDVSSVEQILFNLVDNACKYAGRAADRRIHIAAGRSDGFATLSVCDHGPGIPQRDARRLFRAFHKSAREAANSAPGIGLGLALSRRLARRMGGGLRLDVCGTGAPACATNSFPAEGGWATHGACFTLLLPIG